MRRIIMFLLAVSLVGKAYCQEVYKDMNAPMHERIMDLLGRMTVEEKVSLLHSTSPGVPRLGIERYYMGNECLHGVVRPGRFTVFPQAIGLASMWNPKFHYEIATAISDEARGRWNELERGKNQPQHFCDLLTFWSPTVNMARDPRWGRTPETYGEDPFLSGVLGTAFVKGIQGDDPRYLKVVSTPKHFSANNEEHNRFSCVANITERDMREYYLPSFERCIKEGKAQSIMSAYNAINNIPCTANPWLLKKVLREDWGFQGYVVSDCGAVGALVADHNYVKWKETAAMVALNAGLDIECADDVFIEPLLNAYKQHMVTEEQIDSAAYHMLRFRMKMGLFDDPERIPYNHISPDVVGCEKHQAMALEAARQSIVLLKNEKNMLPLNAKRLKKVAVLGFSANSCEFGDYSGKPVREPVSVLQAVKDRLGDGVEVFHLPWVNIDDNGMLITDDACPKGFRAEYFDNPNLEGTPKVRTDMAIDFDPVNQAPDPFYPEGPLSVRWTGEINAPLAGEYDFCFTCDDGCRLFIDGKMVLEDWTSHAMKDDRVTVQLTAGKHHLKAEYYDGGEDKVARLKWKMPDYAVPPFDTYGDEMKNGIKDCDVIIAVMGINKTIEREGWDRETIELPKGQVAFLKDLYSVNKNVVMVLEAGSSMALNWEQANLPAIVDAWYPGEAGGTAVAEVLFGDYNPAGRLPLTFYKSIDDLPDFNDYNISNNRTYQYFTGEPLYPFGYGLSYTSFRYDGLKVSRAGDNVEVAFRVRNTGKYDGDEVAQVYVKFPEMDRPLPLKQLKGFSRVHINKGKAEQVKISIPVEELRLWDDAKGAFYTPQGRYKIFVGKSSADIVLNGEIEL